MSELDQLKAMLQRANIPFREEEVDVVLEPKKDIEGSQPVTVRGTSLYVQEGSGLVTVTFTDGMLLRTKGQDF